MKNVRNTVQAAIKAARWIRLKQGKDVRDIGTSVMSSAVSPALIVDYKMVSLRLNAHGLGGTKVLKRSTGILNRRMASERRKRRPPPIQA